VTKGKEVDHLFLEGSGILHPSVLSSALKGVELYKRWVQSHGLDQ